jgi:Ala-tRNA(Pro) deacylase
MNLQSYLDRMGVSYLVSYHPATFTAQDLAEKEHVSGRKVIKPVIVKADGRFLMCALPASYKVNLPDLAEELRAREIQLAKEDELVELFPDCELGAEPPIGFLYGMATWMDESLANDDRITFQAGTHETAVTLSLNDYRRIVQPEIRRFARPMN